MRIEIERDGNRVGLRLPCTEEKMQAAELAVGISNPTDTCVKLAEMDKRFPALQPLVGRVHNLDHLNLLARMMDGLFGAEYDQFQAAVSLTGATELRDIINLTQNVRNYTLLRPDDTLATIGRGHYLNIHGSYLTADEEKLDLPKVAMDLIASGQGKRTPFGIVFENGQPNCTLFNGVNMPCYYDRDFVFNCKVAYGAVEEYLFLPCHPDEIGKAFHRLGVHESAQCAVIVEDMQYDHTEVLVDGMGNLTGDELGEMNALAKLVEAFRGDDMRKLAAIWKYAQTYDTPEPLSAMIALARHMDDFTFAPAADDEISLGEYLIQDSGKYDYDPGLEEYYNYDRLGRDTIREQDGVFVDGGYIGLHWEIALSDILEQQAEPTMGGMT